MGNKDEVFSALNKGADAIGKGIIAGLAGTIAITISQMIEMKINNRGMSSSPLKIGGKVFGLEPRGQAEREKEKATSEDNEASESVQQKVKHNKKKLKELIHLGYGTTWGLARSAFDLAGIRGIPAALLHFGSVWGTAQVMLPANNVAKPITEWPPKQIAIDVFHHLVYATAAGLVYSGLKKENEY